MRAGTRIMAVVIVGLGVLYIQYVTPLRWGLMMVAFGPVVWWYGGAMYSWRSRAERSGCAGQLGLALQALVVSAVLIAFMVWLASDVLKVWWS